MRYILDENNNPIPCKDLMEWARYREKRNRRVALTQINDEIRVLTIFLGLDYNFTYGSPILFETMIFGGEHDRDQWRYSTYQEALEGHSKACLIASGELNEYSD